MPPDQSFPLGVPDCSRYARRLAQARPELFQAALAAIEQPFDAGAMHAYLAQQTAGDEDALKRTLRRLRQQVMLRVLLPAIVLPILYGVLTGIMIAVARIFGETAPLLFTAFGNRFWNHNLSDPIAALPLQIFNYAISTYEDWHRQAWAGAMVLLALSTARIMPLPRHLGPPS